MQILFFLGQGCEALRNKEKEGSKEEETERRRKELEKEQGPGEKSKRRRTICFEQTFCMKDETKNGK